MITASAPTDGRHFAQHPEQDLRAFRTALGSYATGVTIVSACGSDGQPVGVTVNSFTSLSMDPPLVLWSLSNHAYSRPVFEQAQHFTVHVLGADQVDLAMRFATRGALDKFADIAWGRGENGAPVLPGVATWFQCVRHVTYQGGDHQIYVGRVLKFWTSAKSPLAFHDGQFATCTVLDLA